MTSVAISTIITDVKMQTARSREASLRAIALKGPLPP